MFAKIIFSKQEKSSILRTISNTTTKRVPKKNSNHKSKNERKITKKKTSFKKSLSLNSEIELWCHNQTSFSKKNFVNIFFNKTANILIIYTVNTTYIYAFVVYSGDDFNFHFQFLIKILILKEKKPEEVHSIYNTSIQEM